MSRKAPVRDRILEAALAILGTEGLHGFTQARVAEHAGVRQSHLTYYFPARDDLLRAVTAAFVDAMAAGLAGAAGDAAAVPSARRLAAVARAIADRGHMRMFLGLVIEADTDPALRELVVDGTRRLEEALARAIGGQGAAVRARAVVATLWGLGLYEFAVRPGPGASPRPAALRTITQSLARRES